MRCQRCGAREATTGMGKYSPVVPARRNLCDECLAELARQAVSPTSERQAALSAYIADFERRATPEEVDALVEEYEDDPPPEWMLLPPVREFLARHRR